MGVPVSTWNWGRSIIFSICLCPSARLWFYQQRVRVRWHRKDATSDVVLFTAVFCSWFSHFAELWSTNMPNQTHTHTHTPTHTQMFQRKSVTRVWCKGNKTSSNQVLCIFLCHVSIENYPWKGISVWAPSEIKMISFYYQCRLSVKARSSHNKGWQNALKCSQQDMVNEILSLTKEILFGTMA